MRLEDEVRNLYFAEVKDEDDEAVEMTISRIAHETGLPVAKVRKIIFGKDETGTDPGCPYYLKKYHGDVLPVKKYQEVKGQLILQAEYQLLGVIQKGIAKFIDDPPDTVTELKDLMGMYTQLDKIGRLEDGKPTEIIKQTNYTPRRIIEIIEADPMYGGRKRRWHGEEKEEENYPRRIEGGDDREGRDSGGDPDSGDGVSGSDKREGREEDSPSSDPDERRS